MTHARVTALLTAALLIASVASAQDGWRGGDRGDGVRIRIGRSYHVAPRAVQSDPLIVIAGSVTIDGRVEDEVVVVGGNLRVGPTAIVRGDLTTVGGTITIDPRADVQGTVSEASSLLPWLGVEWPTDHRWWAAAALVLTMIRLMFLLVVAVLVVAVAPRWAGDAGRDSADAPGAAALTGWAVQILFVPAVLALTVALAISVVGIPLMAGVPLLFLALACIWTAGFSATAARVGRALRGQGRGSSDLTGFDAFLGIVVLAAVTIAGHLVALGPAWLLPVAIVIVLCGLTIEYVAWSIGLGAATRVMLAQWRGDQPPRLPANAPAPAM